MSVTPDTQLPREWIEAGAEELRCTLLGWRAFVQLPEDFNGPLDAFPTMAQAILSAVAPLIAEARTREIVERLRCDVAAMICDHADPRVRDGVAEAAGLIEREFSAAPSTPPVVPTSEVAALRERVASLLLDEPSKTQGLYAAVDELQQRNAELEAALAREPTRVLGVWPIGIFQCPACGWAATTGARWAVCPHCVSESEPEYVHVVPEARLARVLEAGNRLADTAHERDKHGGEFHYPGCPMCDAVDAWWALTEGEATEPKPDLHQPSEHEHAWQGQGLVREARALGSPVSKWDDYLYTAVLLVQTCSCGAARRVKVGEENGRSRGDDLRAGRA